MGTVEAHRWALSGFLEWTDSQNLTSPAAFTRATIESYQLFLHHYRSPRTKEPLGVNTQLARLGVVRRFFAWLCRCGDIPANPASDLDLPRKQARRLPKSLSPEELDRLFSLPNPADPLGLRDRTILELWKSRKMPLAVVWLRCYPQLQPTRISGVPAVTFFKFIEFHH